jgi:hypothetical protein
MDSGPRLRSFPHSGYFGGGCHHPHVHCVVPGGGPSLDTSRWISCKPGFFLPVRVLSRLFRRLFLQHLQAAFDQGELRFFGNLAELAQPTAFAERLNHVRSLEWVVYAKPPFGGPKQVLAYLGRYTHRVAIANSRLIDIEKDCVRFRWKDYRHHDKAKVMALDAFEFIRRFLLHTLPDGFHRIRHYGFFANGHRSDKLALCRKLLDVKAAAILKAEPICETTIPNHTCPCCGGVMIITLDRQQPPNRSTRPGQFWNTS